MNTCLCTEYYEKTYTQTMALNKHALCHAHMSQAFRSVKPTILVVERNPGRYPHTVCYY